jgi:hypothetical protein
VPLNGQPEQSMTQSKRYAVVLFEQAATELGELAKPWLHHGSSGTYFYSKRIDPSGNYFHLVLEDPVHLPDLPKQDFELQIPHSFVKAVFYAEDLKRLGFTPTA